MGKINDRLGIISQKCQMRRESNRDYNRTCESLGSTCCFSSVNMNQSETNMEAITDDLRLKELGNGKRKTESTTSLGI